MAVPDGWPPARVSGCTEPGLQAASPAACLSCHLRCVLTGLYFNRRPPDQRALDPPGMHPHLGYLAAAALSQMKAAASEQGLAAGSSGGAPAVPLCSRVGPPEPCDGR